MKLFQIKEYGKTDKNNFKADCWYQLNFIDDITALYRVFFIRMIKLGFNMSLNDLCFCGSGEKQKKCHPNISSNSPMANLIHLQRCIDSDALGIDNSVCKKGCSDCCASDFPVSLVEFFSILRFIGINYDDNFLEKTIATSNNILLNDKCIFVDGTTKECGIYEVRPLICRKYGTYAEFTGCPKIISCKEMFCNLPYCGVDTETNVSVFNSKRLEKRILSQPKPLIVWFANMKNKELASQRMKDLYFASFNRSIDEFVNIYLI